MHEHLRAWREHRGLTLEQVGNSLGKKHSTVGRWERGLLKLTTANLQALADLYRATPSQMLVPPAVADLVATLDRVQAIISRKDPESLEHWLALGDRLPDAKP